VIGFLRGRLVATQPPVLWLDVQGVGYEIEAPMTTFYDLPASGEEVTLHTHLLVREDAQILFGFLRARDRQLFRDLIRISGVGARLALAVLSAMTAETFVSCVAAGDSAALVRIPGIGRKTAQRLLVELKDRLDGWEADAGAAPVVGSGDTPRRVAPVEEAVTALMALGYKAPEASRLVRAVAAEDLGVEEIIRRALQAATG